MRRRGVQARHEYPIAAHRQRHQDRRHHDDVDEVNKGGEDGFHCESQTEDEAKPREGGGGVVWEENHQCGGHEAVDQTVGGAEENATEAQQEEAIGHVDGVGIDEQTAVVDQNQHRVTHQQRPPSVPEKAQQ